MKKFILKKISVLFILSILAILFCLYFFIFDFGKTEDSGFAGIGALIFICLGLFGILVDYILAKMFENRITLNIIEFVIIFFISILIMSK